MAHGVNPAVKEVEPPDPAAIRDRARRSRAASNCAGMTTPCCRAADRASQNVGCGDFAELLRPTAAHPTHDWRLRTANRAAARVVVTPSMRSSSQSGAMPSPVPRRSARSPAAAARRPRRPARSRPAPTAPCACSRMNGFEVRGCEAAASSPEKIPIRTRRGDGGGDDRDHETRSR